MIEIHNKSECCGCSACVAICPRLCIKMVEDAEGFLYPTVDSSACTNCHLCEKVCPVINPAPARQPEGVLAAKHVEHETRRLSSSGGVFSALAKQVIGGGGVVFGARWDTDWTVIHDYTETVEGLVAFRGSKYLQSRIGKSYEQAAKFLRDGRKVLFSGTPCQIAGLRLFLRRDYQNLFLVDVICHAVPSPKIFREFLRGHLEDASEPGEVCGITFKHKGPPRFTWHNPGFVISTRAPNGSVKEHAESSYTSVFGRGFLADLYSRPSCSSCPARNMSSGSDITIGDFWGAKELFPEFCDDFGVSVVCVNSMRGSDLLTSCADRLATRSSNYAAAIKGNPSLLHSSPPHPLRDAFFGAVCESGPIKQKIELYSRRSLRERVSGFVRNRGPLRRLKTLWSTIYKR